MLGISKKFSVYRPTACVLRSVTQSISRHLLRPKTSQMSTILTTSKKACKSLEYDTFTGNTCHSLKLTYFYAKFVPFVATVHTIFSNFLRLSSTKCIATFRAAS
ncbi:hypothetical protein JG688_00004403 [Phytophthora aleatoria]|uniref:Uncharacterized protein n=1 Tax=Phytophthora aleatoria TaxID=2496075 RepID=A0A8J5M9C9_9STRA|nr:hypothetical protein JG688_00004403 [Phytophthora aleatoria]